MNRERVAIIEIGGRGGICHYTYNLIDALSGSSYALLITAREYELDFLPRKFSLEKIIDKKNPYLFESCKILSCIVKNKIKIAHFQTIFSARKDWFLFLALKIMARKIVFTVHNVLPHEEKEKKGSVIFGLKLMYRLSDMLITHSEENKKILMATFGIKSEKICVIPHGNYVFFRNFCRFAPDKIKARQALGLPLEKKIILFFGTIREYKGVLNLLNVFAKLKDERCDACLLMVGRTNKEIEVEATGFISAHNLEDSVSFRPGYVPLEDLGGYFYAADYVILPHTHTYGSGSAHLALAFSKPILASRNQMFLDLVEEGENGFLFEPQDIPDMLQAVKKALVTPAQIQEKMGWYSSQVALKYGWEDIASKTQEAYRKLLKP